MLDDCIKGTELRGSYGKDRDRESARANILVMGDDQLPDDWEPSGPAKFNLRPCPVITNGSCSKASCVDCKMPKVMEDIK